VRNTPGMTVDLDSLRHLLTQTYPDGAPTDAYVRMQRFRFFRRHWTYRAWWAEWTLPCPRVRHGTASWHPSRCHRQRSSLIPPSRQHARTHRPRYCSDDLDGTDAADQTLANSLLAQNRIRAVRDGPSKASVSVAKVSIYPPEGLQASCKHEVASSSTTAGSTPTTR